ncbi:MAG: hypothetical protein U0525_03910 [Patescibacteria group bacterium]
MPDVKDSDPELTSSSKAAEGSFLATSKGIFKNFAANIDGYTPDVATEDDIEYWKWLNAHLGKTHNTNTEYICLSQIIQARKSMWPQVNHGPRIDTYLSRLRGWGIFEGDYLLNITTAPDEDKPGPPDRVFQVNMFRTKQTQSGKIYP